MLPIQITNTAKEIGRPKNARRRELDTEVNYMGRTWKAQSS